MIIIQAGGQVFVDVRKLDIGDVIKVGREYFMIIERPPGEAEDMIYLVNLNKGVIDSMPIDGVAIPVNAKLEVNV